MGCERRRVLGVLVRVHRLRSLVLDHDRSPVRLQPVVRATVKLLRDILPDTVRIEVTARTPLAAVAAGAEVIRQEPNQGKGAALRYGFACILKQQSYALWRDLGLLAQICL